MVFDCFMFFNELELLELRLQELGPVVDKFVLVESTKTLPGLPKPLYFAENRERFAAYADRIIHVVVDDMPGGEGPRDHWIRERFQRNAIARGLAGCRPDDVIIVSDIDEIPKVQTLQRFVASMRYSDGLCSRALHAALNSRWSRYLLHRRGVKRILRKNHPFVWKFEQYPCCYYLNLMSGEVKEWYGSKIMHYRDFSVAEEMRHSGYKVIKDGGWHFSYMGGASRILAKVAATAHQEINNQEWIERALQESALEQVARQVSEGALELLPLEKLPATLQRDREKYASWLIDPVQLGTA